MIIKIQTKCQVNILTSQTQFESTTFSQTIEFIITIRFNSIMNYEILIYEKFMIFYFSFTTKT